MAEDLVSLLGAIQLADSFFPSGLYTLSHGLESFVAEGRTRTPDELHALIEDYLEGMVGGSDAVATAQAALAARDGDLDTLCDIDRRLWSMKLAHEAAVAAARTGRRMLEVAAAICSDSVVRDFADRVRSGQAPGTHAVAVGVLGHAWGLSPARAAGVELYAYTTGLLGAALRIIRLDHIQAQRILCDVEPLIANLADAAACTSYRDMCSWAPFIEIMQMRHERLPVRLFVS